MEGTAYSWTAEELNTETRYQFTGQEHDESGIYYYGARYYDPALGRFLQADTVLAGLNRYDYCYNNPVIYNDPGGHIPLLAAVIITTAATILANIIWEFLPDEAQDWANDNLDGATAGCSADTGGYVSYGGATYSPGAIEQANAMDQALQDSIAHLDAGLSYLGYYYQGHNGMGGNGETYADTYVNDRTAYNELAQVDLFNPVHLESDYRVSSPFGPRIDPFTGKIRFHTGIDYASTWDPKKNVPIYPAHYGVVSKVGWTDKVGNYLVISYTNANTSKPVITLYYHLKTISAKEGEFASPYRSVGFMGTSGASSTGRHLHFEVRYGNKAVDSLLFNQRWLYNNY